MKTNHDNAKTTMTLMLRAFQTAASHITDGEHREKFEAMLAAQGIDDIDALIGDFIELMSATSRPRKIDVNPKRLFERIARE